MAFIYKSYSLKRCVLTVGLRRGAGVRLVFNLKLLELIKPLKLYLSKYPPTRNSPPFGSAPLSA